MSELMNVMDILILAVVAVSVIAGMFRGFLASGLHTAGFVGAWFVSKMYYTRLATAVLSNRSLMGVLSNYLEPENFFPSLTVANMSVADAITGGQLDAVSEAIGDGLPFIRDAFMQNVKTFAFSDLNITTLRDYLDQTVWVGLFNVLSFLLIFALSYAVIVMIVNLFSNVFNFPSLRWFDRLLGGAFGLVRGAVVALLAVTLLPMVLDVFMPDLMAQMQAQSTLLPFFETFDFMSVQTWITTLLAG